MKLKRMDRLSATVLGIVLVASVALGIYGRTPEAENVWEIAVFFAFYGFVGCVVIIYASKAVGKIWLQRPEDYYAPYGAPTEVGAALEDSGESEPVGGREPEVSGGGGAEGDGEAGTAGGTRTPRGEDDHA